MKKSEEYLIILASPFAIGVVFLLIKAAMLIFEISLGYTLGIAAVVITWLVIWMTKITKAMSEED